jgi:hypothetical protein
VRTVGFLFPVAVIAVGLVGIERGARRIAGIHIPPVSLLEHLVTDVTVGIEAGFAFRGQGIAAPVQVRHADPGIDVVQAKNGCGLYGRITSVLKEHG